MDIVLYHAGCKDGFCAAWLFNRIYPKARYVPCHYGDIPPDVTGLDVAVVDFSFPRATLLAMKERAKSLVVLDHHKTAQEDLAGLDFCTFDMEKSGARLAWEWLKKNGNKDGSGRGWFFTTYHQFDSSCPFLVSLTEDRDLWRWQIPHSKEMNAALQSLPMTFEYWDGINDEAGAPGVLRLEGRGILRYQEQSIADHIKFATDIEVDGYTVPAVNCTCAGITSEVAGELAKGRHFGVCYFQTPDNFLIYSLRSSAPDGMDVSVIAKKLGGGGHKHAAGFRRQALSVSVNS